MKIHDADQLNAELLKIEGITRDIEGLLGLNPHRLPPEIMSAIHSYLDLIRFFALQVSDTAGDREKHGPLAQREQRLAQKCMERGYPVYSARVIFEEKQEEQQDG